MPRGPPDRTANARPTWTVGAARLLLLLLGVAVLGLVVVTVPPVADVPGEVGPSDPRDGGDAVSRDRWPAVLDVASSPDGVVTVTYATGTDATRQFVATGVDAALVDADADWAYLPRSSLPSALDPVDGDHAAGVVSVGEWVLVGDLAAATERAGPTSITVVAPAGMDVDPGRKASFLAEFVSPYAFQPSASDGSVSSDRPTATDRVVLVVAPDALPSDGRMYGDRGYITQPYFWDGEVGSVWIHEYVHARQAFALAPGMRWFEEASATYLSYRVMEEQYGEVTEADVLTRLRTRADYADTALANRSAWDGSHADYHRGARLLYVVDAAVREGSDGEHTLVDVFRALNERSEPVTVDEFVRIVEAHSGEREPWLRAAITDPGDLDGLLAEAADAFED